MRADPSATHVTLRLRALLEYRPVAIELVSALVAQVASADRAFRDEVITAFGEAFNNVVTHGYRGRVDGVVDIDAEMTADRITLRLSDRGARVDFARIRPPDLESMPESGMGVFMMHALVDEVSYSAGEPNVLTLMKRVR